MYKMLNRILLQTYSRVEYGHVRGKDLTFGMLSHVRYCHIECIK
jgi:hypothetical protein